MKNINYKQVLKVVLPIVGVIAAYYGIDVSQLCAVVGIIQ